jgi:hypothetical protein
MPLIRCRHLSLYWLSALATSRIPVPAQLLPQLSNLLAARSLQCAYQEIAQDANEWFSGVCAAWALPQRAKEPVSSVQVTWPVAIDNIRQAVERSVATNSKFGMRSISTAPINGSTYNLHLICSAKDGRCTLGIFAAANDVPDGLCWGFRFHWCWAHACPEKDCQPSEVPLRAGICCLL